MMDFILLMVAIYVALVAASLTLMMLAVSKWYIKKCQKMTMNIIENFDYDCVGHEKEES